MRIVSQKKASLLELRGFRGERRCPRAAAEPIPPVGLVSLPVSSAVCPAELPILEAWQTWKRMNPLQLHARSVVKISARVHSRRSVLQLFRGQKKMKPGHLEQSDKLKCPFNHIKGHPKNTKQESRHWVNRSSVIHLERWKIVGCTVFICFDIMQVCWRTKTCCSKIYIYKKINLFKLVLNIECSL